MTLYLVIAGFLTLVIALVAGKYILDRRDQMRREQSKISRERRMMEERKRDQQIIYEKTKQVTDAFNAAKEGAADGRIDVSVRLKEADNNLKDLNCFLHSRGDEMVDRSSFIKAAEEMMALAKNAEAQIRYQVDLMRKGAANPDDDISDIPPKITACLENFNKILALKSVPAMSRKKYLPPDEEKKLLLVNAKSLGKAVPPQLLAELEKMEAQAAREDAQEQAGEQPAKPTRPAPMPGARLKSRGGKSKKSD